MSKTVYEIAAEVTSEVIKARSQAIATIDSVPSQKEFIDKYLSDEAVSETFKTIYKTIDETFK